MRGPVTGLEIPCCSLYIEVASPAASVPESMDRADGQLRSVFKNGEGNIR
jgi:hypothetical protein